ncbi:unnamed protein product [Lymnaea stagnalis]|uniref:Uncharacterized protein n=1 Tax=Lymnaea stagnalis TaxID=6523 RepID=A0AAV2INU1_LYMST
MASGHDLSHSPPVPRRGNFTADMDMCWTLVVSVIFLVAIGCSYSSYHYNCEKGVYETLYRITEACRETSYAPNLKTFRKNEQRISGQTIVEMFENYCGVAEKIHKCGQDMVDFIPCLVGQQENYDTMVARSHWFCDGVGVREGIKSTFANLSTEELDYRLNACYREAPGKTYHCVRRSLGVAGKRPERKESMKRILASFRCSFRKLSRDCPRDTAFLLTTMEYDWLIIPPALGFNISDVLFTASNIKLPAR